MPSQDVALGPSGSSLADVLTTILDKGLVIDIYVNVQLLGLDLLTIHVRIVIASVDTWLRFAKAVNEMNLEYDTDMPVGGVKRTRMGQGQTLGEFAQDAVSGVGQGVGQAVGSVTEGVTSGGAKGKTRGAVEGVKEAVTGKRRKS